MSEFAELVVPEFGESIIDAIVSRWRKQVGDQVAAGEPIVELETDKITVQLAASQAGVLAERCCEEGGTVRVGEVVARVATVTDPEVAAAGAPISIVADAGAAEVAAAAAGSEMPPLDATWPARPSKMVTPRRPPAPAEAMAKPSERLGPAERRRLREEDCAPVLDPRQELVPMSPLRKRIAERLLEAQRATASLTSFNEIDLSRVVELRRAHGRAFEARHGVRLGLLSFFVKACVNALRQFPILNAEVREDAILYKHHYDLGIAVDTDRGLIVPVLRHADQLGFAEIEGRIADLARRAREGGLLLRDLVGGTFTITNGGSFGSMMSTPLLNHPQTGILGIHKAIERPVAVAGEVVIRPMMYVALTYDHRVVDGRDAIKFLLAVKSAIESPELLMLELGG